MKIIIKILKGPECTMEVEECLCVSELKDQIYSQLQIEPQCQRLVYKGKPLADGKQLGDYGIQEESKIFVTVRDSGKGSNPAANLPIELSKFLRKHFTDENAAIIAEHFHKSLQEQLRTMSLDDIERYSKNILDSRNSASTSS